MTTMHDCIQTAIDNGEIDKVRGRAAQTEYARLKARYLALDMTEGQASIRATADLKEAAQASQRERYHKVLHQLQTMRKIKHFIDTTPDPSRVLTGLMRQAEGHGFKGNNVEKMIEAWEDRTRMKMQEVLDEVGLNMVGSSRDTARMDNIIRERHGEATGDVVAKKLAKVLEDAEDMLIRALNERGANITILKNRGMGQSHDGGRMRAAGFEKWAAFTETRLAWDKIDDLATGQPFAAAPGQVPPRAVTQRFLQDVYDGRISGGWNSRDPSMVTGGKALFNRRAEHRLLHFKNGTTQLEYNREFGTADPFSSMIHSLMGMARDVALMDVLGPNPAAMLEFAHQAALARAAELGSDPRLMARVDREAARAKAMLHEANGSASITEWQATARFMSGTRAVLSSAQLGSAVISSVTDLATMTVAAQTVGMNARNVLSRSIELTAKHSTRATANRMGFTAETLADAGAGSARFMGKMFGSGIAERLSGITMKASGLAFVTDMRKIAFQMEFSGYLAENAGRDFAQIDHSLRRIFEARGISARDWDFLRASEGRFVADNGADFIAPFHWLEAQKAMPRREAEDLAMRMQMIIREQLEFAVPTASLEARAGLLFGTKAGTIGGEVARSGLMYKSFPLSLMLGQYRRFLNIEGGWNKARYLAKIAVLLELTGALAIQLKEIAKGNDPRPMNTLKFWLAAALQGGGLGIFGDFFAAEASRAGGGIAETLAGPVVGLISDIGGPIVRNTTAPVNGENTHWGRDATNLVRGTTPVASSLWYGRAAFSRLVADGLQTFLDPQAKIQMRRQLRQMQKDYGTQNFVPRLGMGQKLRAPNLMNAFGDGK